MMVVVQPAEMPKYHSSKATQVEKMTARIPGLSVMSSAALHFAALATMTPMDNATRSLVEVARLAAVVVEVVRSVVAVAIAHVHPSPGAG